jgi:hypothetical protein
MAIFKSNPEKALQRDIDAAKANRDRLAAKLAESETAIIERRSTAQALARDGADDSMLDRAEAAIRSAQDRAATIAGAIADVEQQLMVLENNRAENEDRILREKTASEIELLARSVTTAAAALTAAAATLADCTVQAAVVVPEAAGLLNFAVICGNEIPQASDLTSKLLRQHAASVLVGSAPARLPKPPEPYVEPVVERPKTTQLFALRSVRWRDAAGVQQLGQKFSDVNLTELAAVRALKSGACVPISDPLRRKHKGWSTEIPRADLAFDLDADPATEEQPREPIQHSQFEQVDRGQGFTLRVAR